MASLHSAHARNNLWAEILPEAFPLPPDTFGNVLLERKASQKQMGKREMATSGYGESPTREQ